MLIELSHFTRFLELAASESGQPANFTHLSKHVGVAHTTISSYYQILEDCLIVERVEPLLNTSTRRRIVKSQKYLFFDLGVRRVAAREGNHPPNEYLGHLFEQFIGLELIRLTRNQFPQSKIRYWRDANEPEVDWILDTSDELIPIEVKCTDSPKAKDARHLKTFLEEHPQAKKAFIICQCPQKMQLSDHIIALPWQQLSNITI